MELTTLLSAYLNTAKLAVDAYKNYPIIKRFFNKIFKKPIRILVTGESGSGKTQFLSTIQGQISFSNQRTMLTHKSVLVLPNGRRIEFWDLPGHQSLKKQREVILNEVSRKKFDGIVNVVCYGYQSVDDMDMSDVFQGDVVKESYLKGNREKELKQMQEWLPHVDVNSGVKWVLTLINKVDIWSENYNDVFNYYSGDNQYHRELEQLVKVATLDVVPYCSLISPFLGKSMLISFGEKEKYIFHLNLCKHLSDLIGIEWLK